MSNQELELDAQRIAIITSMLREFPSVRTRVIDWLYRFHAKEIRERLQLA